MCQLHASVILSCWGGIFCNGAQRSELIGLALIYLKPSATSNLGPIFILEAGKVKGAASPPAVPFSWQEDRAREFSRPVVKLFGVMHVSPWCYAELEFGKSKMVSNRMPMLMSPYGHAVDTSFIIVPCALRGTSIYKDAQAHRHANAHTLIQEKRNHSLQHGSGCLPPQPRRLK